MLNGLFKLILIIQNNNCPFIKADKDK